MITKGKRTWEKIDGIVVVHGGCHFVEDGRSLWEALALGRIWIAWSSGQALQSVPTSIVCKQGECLAKLELNMVDARKGSRKKKNRKSVDYREWKKVGRENGRCAK